MERSGAAQGLAEVLGVLGPEYLAGLLPDILATCGAKSAFAREGSLTLFKFLPLVAPDECQASACCQLNPVELNRISMACPDSL